MNQIGLLYVCHKRTNQTGKVFGYGYKIVEGTYWTTLKVELLEEGELKGFRQDVYTEWIPCEARIRKRDCQLKGIKN